LGLTKLSQRQLGAAAEALGFDPFNMTMAGLNYLRHLYLCCWQHPDASSRADHLRSTVFERRRTQMKIGTAASSVTTQKAIIKGGSPAREIRNRFTRAVAVGNPREFTSGDKEEQEIAEACNRLVKNAIVCWNYLLLEHRLSQAPSDEAKAEIRAAGANHSIISWAQINLLGEYDFSDEKLRDSVGIPPPKNRL
jgi:hypothetical protein